MVGKNRAHACAKSPVTIAFVAGSSVAKAARTRAKPSVDTLLIGLGLTRAARTHARSAVSHWRIIWRIVRTETAKAALTSTGFRPATTRAAISSQQRPANRTVAIGSDRWRFNGIDGAGHPSFMRLV